MSEGLIGGFARRTFDGHDGVVIDALVGGSGPPLLLLHGYPQTRMIWKHVAPALAQRFTVVVPDLRGYGRSGKPAGDERHAHYSKRTMGLDQLATMRALGFDRFAVSGHDRGARVAYRLALDHPDAITRLAVLDIIPTGDVWAHANASSAMTMYHWYMLAQPAPLPETFIGADPAFYLRWTIRSWAAPGFVFDEANVADYVACFRDPAAIHASCEDYRAGWTLDREADEADRGKRHIAVPTLALWGEGWGVGRAQPLEKWRAFAPDVRGRGLPCGHFVCEEAPEAVTQELLAFF